MPEHNSISDRALTGFAKSAEYDQNRPTYTATVTQELMTQLRVAGKSKAKILDLAAGTGLFTAVLASREENYDIVAVEPHDGMRDVLAAKNLSGVKVLSGTAQKIPLEDESVDAVVAAQAFHWFANKEALREIHRVLKPHGCFGVIWNIEDYNAPQSHKATTAWEAQAHDIIWSFDDNEPRFRNEKWRTVFDEQIKSTPMSLLVADDDQLFSLPLGEDKEPFTVWLAKGKVWERFSTLSQIAILEGEELEKTKQKFMNALDESDVNEKGEVAIHGNTYFAWSSKIPSEGRKSLTSVERPGA